MRQAITLLFILSLLISPLLYSQESAGVRFELVKSKTLPKSVHRWLFPGEKTIISIGEDQITWQRNSEIRRFTLPKDVLKVITSKGGNYFAIVRLSPLSEQNLKESRALRIEVYTAGQEHLYTIERPLEYDDPLPLIALSDREGALVIGRNTTGELRFFNSEGKVLRTVRLFEGVGYDMERALQIDLTRDGEMAAVVAGKRGASPAGSNAPHPSAEPHLFLFSLQGVELWRTPLPDFNTSAVAISDNGQYIAANSYTITLGGKFTKRTLVYDRSGNEIGQANILFKRAAFSPDEKFLILADNHLATVMNLETGNIPWHYSLSKGEGMITAVAVSNGGEISALLVARSELGEGTFMFTNPRLKILNSTGDLQQELELTGQVFEKPALKLSADAKKIFIGFRNAYQVYRTKQ
ncbi:MAG: hypothetical protein D6748_04865 [Calditrichaeota bacterium]|nr:MAG: hypothetical protein D6748_04865 [Calditrichota bacterium]